MWPLVDALRGGARATLVRADWAFNRLYGWRLNPLYHSGALVVASCIVILLTGVYLLVFYRIGGPYASVENLTGQAWTGRWIRSLHRYASDVAVLAALVHAFRVFAQGRSWGQRAVAWVSGLVLVAVLLVSGWTGYVMVWDAQAQLLAEEGARFLDALPIFSEPIGRAFVGARALPAAFFFLNLFLHIALPIGMAFILWIHVARVARPTLLPSPPLLWGVVGLLTAVSVLWPVTMAAPADLFRVPEEVTLDLFYAFFLPFTRAAPAWAAWAAGSALSAILLLAPVWTGPRRHARPPPSWVDERLCTGCEQCFLDCPYNAVSMVARADGREGNVARVDPELCVSCGICAGSCAPMGIGPPGRTGRDQLSRMRSFLAGTKVCGETVVVVACERAAGEGAALARLLSSPVFPVRCAGELHTSVIELAVRAGAGGVLVVSCPPRDCWSREGGKWTGERMFRDREAELHARVDRARVRLVYATAAEREGLAAELEALRQRALGLEVTPREERIVLNTECDVAERGVTVRMEGGA